MNLLSKPKTPSSPDPAPAAAPPATTDAAAAGQAEAERVRRKRGTAATILTSDSAARPGSVATKTLLGA